MGALWDTLYSNTYRTGWSTYRTLKKKGLLSITNERSKGHRYEFGAKGRSGQNGARTLQHTLLNTYIWIERLSRRSKTNTYIPAAPLVVSRDPLARCVPSNNLLEVVLIQFSGHVLFFAGW